MGSPRGAEQAERNDMTAKRDLKRRVRQRQARTGESYVTARRRVLAARGQPDKRADADAEPGEATEREETIERAAERRGQTRGAMVERMEATGGETEARRSTIELEATQPGATVELGEDRATTEHGEREAAQRHQSGEALRRAAKLWRETGQLVNLRVGRQDALVRTAGDAGTARMFAVAFGLPSRPFVQVVPEPYRRETLLKFTVRGRRGAVEIACRLWLPAPTLILRLADEIEPVLLATQDAPMHLGAEEGPRVSGPQ